MELATAPSETEPRGGGKTLVIGWRGATTPVLEALGQTVTYVLAPGEVTTARASGFRGELIAVPDPTNVEHVLSGLRRHEVDLDDFHAVGTNQEFTLVAASVVGSIARARSMTPKAAVLLRDKVAQKAAVRKAGLPVASCYTVGSLTGLPATDDSYPAVVKPLAGAGAKDTFLLTGAQEAARLAAERPGSEGAGPWVVEEYIEGPEIMLDGVVRDGRPLFFTVSRYLQNLIEIKTGGLVGTVLLERDIHPRTYDQADDLLTRALTALEHTDGVFHLEAFDQGDRLVFSECAGRTAGGMIREKLAHKFGVDLVAEWGRALLGLPADINTEPLNDFCYGGVNLLAPPGEILSIPDVEQLLARPGVVEARVEIAPGAVATDPSISSDTKAGRIVVAAETEDTAESLLKSTAAWFTARTTVK